MSPYIHVIFHASSARGKGGSQSKEPFKVTSGRKEKINHWMSNELSFLKRHKLLLAPGKIPVQTKVIASKSSLMN